VVNDEDGVEEQRRVEESKEAETRMSPWLLLAGRRLHWKCFDLALLQKPSYELCSCGASWPSKLLNREIVIEKYHFLDKY
jgi:hypothetical protein